MLHHKSRSACGEVIHVRQILAELWPLTLRIFTHFSLSSQLLLHPCRDAEIFMNKQVKFKDSKNNASPKNKICSYISSFMPVRMKLCQSKQADLLFSASLSLHGFEWNCAGMLVKGEVEFTPFLVKNSLHSTDFSSNFGWNEFRRLCTEIISYIVRIYNLFEQVQGNPRQWLSIPTRLLALTHLVTGRTILFLFVVVTVVMWFDKRVTTC